ncbi:hypothetical protein APX00_13900 (plasmid) [Staphylococcus aureus]|nr:hypothetical protein APX00_13900 [Staphylococcus aureus]
MNKDTVLDKGYVIATILNVFFLLGLIFISHFENLYILILYVILKRSLFILQIILGIFLLFFIYKQMNQNHLDTWFILYTVFFIFFSSWFDKHYKKS